MIKSNLKKVQVDRCARFALNGDKSSSNSRN